MSYESPIKMITKSIVKDITEKQDAYLVECVHKVGFDVDAEELRKALAYDRGQYEKGYRDGIEYQRERVSKLKALASKLLAKYQEEATACIWEYSGRIDESLDYLEEECKKLQAEIDDD